MQLVGTGGEDSDEIDDQDRAGMIMIPMRFLLHIPPLGHILPTSP